MYNEFDAMAQGATDYTVKAIAVADEKYGTMLTILASEEAVYITKAQAMAFFGLVDPTA